MMKCRVALQKNLEPHPFVYIYIYNPFVYIYIYISDTSICKLHYIAAVLVGKLCHTPWAYGTVLRVDKGDNIDLVIWLIWVLCCRDIVLSSLGWSNIDSSIFWTMHPNLDLD